MRVLITGATGLIGRHLVRALAERGDDVVATSRRKVEIPGARAVRWSPEEGPLPPDEIDGMDAVVNLAGVGTGARRWSRAYKAEIKASRQLVTTSVVSSVLRAGTPIFLSASGVGYDGSRGDEELDEDSSPGNDFRANLAHEWEELARPAEVNHTRVVLLRFGIVMAANGGLLPRLLPFARLGLLGPIGGGQQWFSWIHIDDVTALILATLDNNSLRGPINITAPNPVRQRVLARTLGIVLHRPAVLPMPTFALRLLFGEYAKVLFVDGQRIIPRVAQAFGYKFKFSQLEQALRAECRESR